MNWPKRCAAVLFRKEIERAFSTGEEEKQLFAYLARGKKEEIGRLPFAYGSRVAITEVYIKVSRGFRIPGERATIARDRYSKYSSGDIVPFESKESRAIKDVSIKSAHRNGPNNCDGFIYAVSPSSISFLSPTTVYSLLQWSSP